jgi:hypothetical protein
LLIVPGVADASGETEGRAGLPNGEGLPPDGPVCLRLAVEALAVDRIAIATTIPAAAATPERIAINSSPKCFREMNIAAESIPEEARRDNVVVSNQLSVVSRQ